MENKLEQLLNSLIEKGFRPFGRYDKLMGSGRFGSRQFVKFGIFPEEEFTLRELTSINSGLWQFVCENGMVNVDETEVYYFWLKRKGTLDRGHYYLSEAGEDIRTNNYEYRLIESSLKDESELEDFLLNSISLHE